MLAPAIHTPAPAAHSTGLIPQLHRPFADPKIRFALSDAPTALEVERSAIIAAAIRGFASAFERRALFADASAYDIPGMPPEFGGHPRLRPEGCSRRHYASSPTSRRPKAPQVPPPNSRPAAPPSASF